LVIVKYGKHMNLSRLLINVVIIGMQEH